MSAKQFTKENYVTSFKTDGLTIARVHKLEDGFHIVIDSLLFDSIKKQVDGLKYKTDEAVADILRKSFAGEIRFSFDYNNLISVETYLEAVNRSNKQWLFEDLIGETIDRLNDKKLACDLVMDKVPIIALAMMTEKFFVNLL